MGSQATLEKPFIYLECLKSFVVSDWILQCILQCHELATITSGPNLAVAHAVEITLFFGEVLGFREIIL